MSWYRCDAGATAGKAPPLSARECSAAAVWRGGGGPPQVLITNGNDASERFRDLVEFDPRTLRVAKYESAQQRGGATAVSAHTLATCDGRFFYQFGGWDGMHDQAETARYDVRGLTGRSGAAAVACTAESEPAGAPSLRRPRPPIPAFPPPTTSHRPTCARGQSCT